MGRCGLRQDGWRRRFAEESLEYMYGPVVRSPLTGPTGLNTSLLGALPYINSRPSPSIPSGAVAAKTPATSTARDGPYLLVRVTVRPEHDRAQSCAIALRSPASERPSDLNRSKQSITPNCPGSYPSAPTAAEVAVGNSWGKSDGSVGRAAVRRRSSQHEAEHGEDGARVGVNVGPPAQRAQHIRPRTAVGGTQQRANRRGRHPFSRPRAGGAVGCGRQRRPQPAVQAYERLLVVRVQRRSEENLRCAYEVVNRCGDVCVRRLELRAHRLLIADGCDKRAVGLPADSALHLAAAAAEAVRLVHPLEQEWG
eukprot:scaffold100291_cov61-Phaeocystis_antarctica.AAC.4